MTRRILVTGSSGFVGRHAIRALAKSAGPGDSIVGLGRLGQVEDPVSNVGFLKVDLLDTVALSSAVADIRPTHILHLAALSSVHQANRSPLEAWRTNIVGLLNLADATIVEAAGATMVYVSSGEVYGSAFIEGSPVTESTIPAPRNVYSRTKLAGESLLSDLLPSGDVKLITLRPFNHVGPGQDTRFVVASFADQIARIECGMSPPQIDVGQLSPLRDFLDVRDVVDAYRAVIYNSGSLPHGSLYNVCSGVSRTIASVLTDLQTQSTADFTIHVAGDRARPTEIPVTAGDASLIREAMGWCPSIPWEKTLADVLDYARSNVRLQASNRQGS